MRSLILLFALLLCAPAHAAGIPSDASGVFLGTDRVCRIVLARYQRDWLQADVACIGFDGAYTVSLTTLYAPEAGACWPDNVAINLKPWAPGEYLALRAYDVQRIELQIIRGTDQNAVANANGTSEPWYRLSAVPSPAPFTCASAPAPHPYSARLCREYGLFCGR